MNPCFSHTPKSQWSHIIVSDCEANSRPLPAEDGQEQKAGQLKSRVRMGPGREAPHTSHTFQNMHSDQL